jgi:hypothetical protein
MPQVKGKIICIHCKKKKEPFREGRNVCKKCRYDQKKLTRKPRKDYMHNRIRKLPEQYLLKNAKTRARKNGLDFNLTIEDIIIPLYCPIFGTKIILKKDTNQRGQTQRNYDGPSIDRIEGNRGYVKGNIVICSWRANLFKGQMTFAQIKAWYKFLKNHNKINEES